MVNQTAWLTASLTFANDLPHSNPFWVVSFTKCFSWNVFLVPKAMKEQQIVCLSHPMPHSNSIPA
jgi:hypothetical protein